MNIEYIFSDRIVAMGNVVQVGVSVQVQTSVFVQYAEMDVDLVSVKRQTFVYVSMVAEVMGKPVLL